MKKEIADLWVKALRSGNYQQGNGQLRNVDDKFCCLGVLCNVHAERHPRIARREGSPLEYMHSFNMLPVQVKEWAGMRSVSGEMRTGLALWELNDCEGWSFERIADHIEKHWEAL